jgi:hypothetical protein
MEAPATPAELREKAARYREMVALAIDQLVIDALNVLADEYEALANKLEHGDDPAG